MITLEKLKESDPELNDLCEEIEIFVDWIFRHHVETSRKDYKVIHDAVWGTNRYDNFEIALINTPLIQRLRQIHQTANAFLNRPDFPGGSII